MTDPAMNSQAGTGAQASASQPDPSQVKPAEQQTEKPLTAEEYRQIAREEAIKAAQSFTDKAERRISEKAQAQIDALKINQEVLGLSNEEMEAATTKIVVNDIKAPRQAAQASTTPAPQATQAQTQEELHPAVAAILEINAVEKMEVTETDPEWEKYIKSVWNDPNGTVPQLRKQYYKALDSKRERMQTQQQQGQARVVSGGGQNTNATEARTARDYFRDAHRK